LDLLIGVAVSDRRLDRDDLGDARALGQEAAEGGVALAPLLDLYLSAKWRLWEGVAAGANTVPGEDVATAGAASFKVADEVVAALAQGYEAAQRLAIRREEALRREFVDDLLAGLVAEDALAERAARFGFNLAMAHAAVEGAPGRCSTPSMPTSPSR